MRVLKVVIAVVVGLLLLVTGGIFLGSGKVVVFPNVGRFVDKARLVKVNADLNLIIRAAEYFKVANNRYPGSLQELTTAKIEGEELISPEVVIDPWGRRYVYRMVGGKPEAVCLGADGVEGGDGVNQDIRVTTSEPDESSSSPPGETGE